MGERAVRIAASRIVVVMPSWLGDGVMATPFLRALRGLYPAARIAAVARPLVAPVLRGLGVDETAKRRNGESAKGWIDEIKVCEKGAEGEVVRWMRAGGFELGVLLPNSFRSAWMLWNGRVKRRVGYARGGRSWLLTDRVQAVKRTGIQRALDQRKADVIRAAGGTIKKIGSWYQPLPTVEYYLEIARCLCGEGAHRPAPPEAAGVSGDERRTELGVTKAERAEAEAALAEMGMGDAALVVVVPGASFGSSKCWSPERFAAVADGCVERYGARVLMASAPTEMGVVEAILAASRFAKEGKSGMLGGAPAPPSMAPVVALAKLNNGKGVSLGALKEIVRRSRLMVCNDTGPRHFAAAFGVPCVTLFGPTDPVWAETFSPRERIVRVEVPCGPCQLKQCPIDHRCMKEITSEMVMAAIAGLWEREGGGAG